MYIVRAQHRDTCIARALTLDRAVLSRRLLPAERLPRRASARVRNQPLSCFLASARAHGQADTRRALSSSSSLRLHIPRSRPSSTPGSSPPPSCAHAAREYAREDFFVRSPRVHSQFTVSQSPAHLRRSADPAATTTTAAAIVVATATDDDDDDVDSGGRLRVANPSALLPF